ITGSAQNDGCQNAVRIPLPRTGPRLPEVDIPVIASRGPMPVRTDGAGADKAVVICVIGILPPGIRADDILRVRRTPGAVVAGHQQLAAIRAERERGGAALANGCIALMMLGVHCAWRGSAPISPAGATFPAAAMPILPPPCVGPVARQRRARPPARHSRRL